MCLFDYKESYVAFFSTSNTKPLQNALSKPNYRWSPASNRHYQKKKRLLYLQEDSVNYLFLSCTFFENGDHPYFYWKHLAFSNALTKHLLIESVHVFNKT